jgi:hypothetical protein
MSWYPGYCSYVQGADGKRQYMVMDLAAWRERGGGPRRQQLFRAVSLPEQIQDGINFPGGKADFVNGAWKNV